MVGKTSTPTKADRARFIHLREVGCICCRKDGRINREIDIHHIVEGSRRLGHQYTLPLCIWHHRGIGPEGYTAELLESAYGPSLALSKRAFVARYGR